MAMTTDDKTRTELEAAVFRRLVEHLRARTDVQNIDLMNLAGFCRNCLSNWMKDAADAKGVPMTKDESREIVYGMPYDEWKAKHQKEASPSRRRPSKRQAKSTDAAAICARRVLCSAVDDARARLDLERARLPKPSSHARVIARSARWPPLPPSKTTQAAHRFAKDQLKAFVERVERLEEEKKAIADDIRDVYAEAKGNGFDVKALRTVVRLRKQDVDERKEQEAILETYLHALGMLLMIAVVIPAARPAREPGSIAQRTRRAIASIAMLRL